MKHHLATLLHVPSDILAYVGSMFVAAGALVATTIQGLIPAPEDAAMWPFYGVLITAIIVLFLSIAGILRWVSTKWMQQQSATNTVISEINATLQKLVASTDHQNRWFEEFGKNALQMQLDHARMSVHTQQQEGRKPHHA